MRHYALATCLILLPVILIAATIHVPADQPTIQAGIDAASAGDSVIVACGTYYEHDITISSNICIISEARSAECVEIDAMGLGRVLDCSNTGPLTKVSGISIRNGFADGEGEYDKYGGGANCANSSVQFEDCVFVENYAAGWGGAVNCRPNGAPKFARCEFRRNSSNYRAGAVNATNNADPSMVLCKFYDNSSGFGGAIDVYWESTLTLELCIFNGNEAHRSSSNGYGGALSVVSCEVSIESCTFYLNTSDLHGGAIWFDDLRGFCQVTSSTLFGNSSGICGDHLSDGLGVLEIHTTTVSNSFGGPGLFWGTSYGPTIHCSNSWGNVGGDYSGSVIDQATENGNISEDPLFCDPDLHDFTLRSDSPCAPENNDCEVLMGAWPVGCSTSTSNLTWGSIKTLY